MKGSVLYSVCTSLLLNLKRLAQTPKAQARGLTEQVLHTRNATAVAKYLQHLAPTARDYGERLTPSPRWNTRATCRVGRRCTVSSWTRQRDSSWARCYGTTIATHLPR
jgi:hypothetical protein